jgi:hypothetical protein
MANGSGVSGGRIVRPLLEVVAAGAIDAQHQRDGPPACCRVRTGRRQAPTQNAPSREFFEVPEAQTADDGLLDGRDVGIDLVSTERRAHHRPSGATALRLADELGDGLGNVVRIRSVLTLQH